MKRVHFLVKGMVQGVGYRYFVKTQAEALGLSGWVANYPDGSVQGEAQGVPEIIDKFIKKLWNGCQSAVVKEVIVKDVLEVSAAPSSYFEIKYI